jgi:hypothetical protein
MSQQPLIIPNPVLQDTKHIPCRYHQVGCCLSGKACRFSHEILPKRIIIKQTKRERKPSPLASGGGAQSPWWRADDKE